MQKIEKDELAIIINNKNVEIIEYKDNEEWMELRKKGIGGSDVGAILGINEYSSMVDVYLSKVENKKKEINNAMYWGTVLEKTILNEFDKKNNDKYYTFECDYTLKNDIYQANVDGILLDLDTGKYGIIEIKTANAFSRDKWEKGEVPHSYYAQVQHYLGVTGLDFGIIAVLIGGNQYKEFYIQRNENDINLIKKTSLDFWNNYILKKEIPFPDGTDTYSEYQKKLLEKMELKSETIEFKEEERELIDKRQELEKQVKEYTKEIKRIEQLLLNELIKNNVTSGNANDYTVKLITQSRNKINREKLEKENKNLFDSFKELEEKYKENYKINFLKIIERKG